MATRPPDRFLIQGKGVRALGDVSRPQDRGRFRASEPIRAARSATSDPELPSAWSILDVPEARAVPAWRCWRMIAGRRLGALVDAHGMWHRDVMWASCRQTPEHPPSPPLQDMQPLIRHALVGSTATPSARRRGDLGAPWPVAALATGQVELWGRVLGPGWDLPRRVREDRRLSDSRHPRHHRHLMMKRQG